MKEKIKESEESENVIQEKPVYQDYNISKDQSNSLTYSAFKENAVEVDGISFNHHFYFTYPDVEYTNCVINGKTAKTFPPSLTENYYQHNINDGCILLSMDLKTFYYQDSSLGCVNHQPVTLEKSKELINEKGRWKILLKIPPLFRNKLVIYSC